MLTSGKDFLYMKIGDKPKQNEITHCSSNIMNNTVRILHHLENYSFGDLKILKTSKLILLVKNILIIIVYIHIYN